MQAVHWNISDHIDLSNNEVSTFSTSGGFFKFGSTKLNHIASNEFAIAFGGLVIHAVCKWSELEVLAYFDRLINIIDPIFDWFVDFLSDEEYRLVGFNANFCSASSIVSRYESTWADWCLASESETPFIVVVGACYISDTHCEHYLLLLVFSNPFIFNWCASVSDSETCSLFRSVFFLQDLFLNQFFGECSVDCVFVEIVDCLSQRSHFVLGKNIGNLIAKFLTLGFFNLIFFSGLALVQFFFECGATFFKSSAFFFQCGEFNELFFGTFAVFSNSLFFILIGWWFFIGGRLVFWGSFCFFFTAATTCCRFFLGRFVFARIAFARNFFLLIGRGYFSLFLAVSASSGFFLGKFIFGWLFFFWGGFCNLSLFRFLFFFRNSVLLIVHWIVLLFLFSFGYQKRFGFWHCRFCNYSNADKFVARVTGDVFNAININGLCGFNLIGKLQFITSR